MTVLVKRADKVKGKNMRWTLGEHDVVEFRAAQEKVEKAKSLGSLMSVTLKDGETVEGLLCGDIVKNDYPYAVRFQGEVALQTVDNDIVTVCYLDIKDADCTESDEKMEMFMDAGMIHDIDTIEDWF